MLQAKEFLHLYIILYPNGQNIYTRCTMNGVYGNWVKMTPFSCGIDIEVNTDINTLLIPTLKLLFPVIFTLLLLLSFLAVIFNDLTLFLTVTKYVNPSLLKFLLNE